MVNPSSSLSLRLSVKSYLLCPPFVLVESILQKEIKKSGSLNTLVKGQSPRLSVNEDCLILNPLLPSFSQRLKVSVDTPNRYAASHMLNFGIFIFNKLCLSSPNYLLCST